MVPDQTSLPARQRRQRYDADPICDNPVLIQDSNDASHSFDLPDSFDLPYGSDFEYIDHTADVGIKAGGHSFTDALSAAGVALFSLMTDITKIEPTEMKEFTVSLNERNEQEILLYHFLDELLFLYGSEYFIAKKVEVTNPDRITFKCRSWGEKFDRKRHTQGTEIKAITMHEIRVDVSENRTTVFALVDI